MPHSHVQQLAVPLQRPEPRLATNRPGESVYLLEQRSLRPPDDSVRQGRHVKSSSAHYNSDGLSMRRQTYARAKSVDSPARNAVKSTSSAALKAAQLSAGVHLRHDAKSGASKDPLTLGSPHKAPVAAASLAWLNSAAKIQGDRQHEVRTGHNRADITLLQALPLSNDLPLRKSQELSRPLQSEFILPMRPGGRSKSQNSDMMVQEVNNYIHADQIHNGPLQAARISFAQDREAHAHDYSPPPRPSSAHPSIHIVHTDDHHSRSLISLPWGQDRYDTPPPSRKSTETSRAALSAASLTWASHEHDHPRSSTPVVEPYHYMTHKPVTTLRKAHKEESSKFLKHGRVQPMSSADRKRYDGLWAANKGLLLEHAPAFKDEVANIVVRDIWQRSRLQAELLADIYDLVDRSQTGRLTRDEFVVGTWLVDHSLRGRRLPFKQDLTDDLFDSGAMARLGIKVPKKLRQNEKKYLAADTEKAKMKKKKK